MRSVSIRLDESGKNCFELPDSIMRILGATVVRDAGRSDAALDALGARRFAIALVLAAVALGAAISDALAPLALS